MKKLFLSLIFLFSAALIYAQTPNEFNYQAVARDNTGAAMPNHSITVHFTIHDAAAGGTVLYVERQTVTTNPFGLFAVQIGAGTVESGTFANINWGVNTKFLEVGFDPNGGQTYTDMGTTQLISVPFAKVADVALNSPWAVTGNNINNTNSGNVGIGTSSPNYPLEISTAGSWPLGLTTTGTGDNVIRFTTPAGTIGGMGWGETPNGLVVYTYGSRDIVFGYNNLDNEVMRLSGTNGYVGIGTSSPTYPLHVVSGVNTGVEVDGTDSSYAGFFANATVNTARPFYGYMVAGVQQAYTETDKNGDWYLINNGFGNSLAIAAMASGKVGIGTATPSGQLSVVNNGAGLGYPSIYTNNTNTAGIGIYVTTNSTDAAAVITNAAGGAGGNAIMAKFFDGGASDLVRIDNFGYESNEGRVSLFGDNNGNNKGGYVFGSETFGLDLGDIVSNTYTPLFEAYHPTPTTTAVSPWLNNITSSGDATYKWTAVYATNGTIQTSDERLKENIQPISYGLNALMSLQPVSYQWKEKQARLGSGNNLGFLAQDLEKVLPDVVVHTQITQEQIDNAKKYKGVDIENTDTYGVKYSEIIPVLVKAIQEQQAEIEALKAQVKSQNK